VTGGNVARFTPLVDDLPVVASGRVAGGANGTFGGSSSSGSGGDHVWESGVYDQAGKVLETPGGRGVQAYEVIRSVSFTVPIAVPGPGIHKVSVGVQTFGEDDLHSQIEVVGAQPMARNRIAKMQLRVRRIRRIG